MQWTSDRVDTLARLWAEGRSARHIAEMLGGISRNAVIGKAHRLNLQRGVVPAAEPATRAQEPAPFQPAAVPAGFGPGQDDLPPPRPHAPGEVKHWMCRWQTMDAGKYGLYICGKTAQPGRQYCAEHLTHAYLRRKRAVA